MIVLVRSLCWLFCAQLSMINPCYFADLFVRALSPANFFKTGSLAVYMR